MENANVSKMLSESSLCAQWVAKEPSFLHADSEDSDQIERTMSSLGAQSFCWLSHEMAQMLY